MADLLAAPVPAKVALVTLCLVLAISVVTDLRRRLILNAVTLPGLGIIAACVAWLGGIRLLGDAGLGVLVCAGPLALMMWRGWMGAGDVKLMALPGAVSGAAAGWGFSLTILLYVVLAGGVQAVLWTAIARMRGEDRPKYVPYGVSIAAGTIAGFLWGSALF